MCHFFGELAIDESGCIGRTQTYVSVDKPDTCVGSNAKNSIYASDLIKEHGEEK
jgi:hypothetical protein